MNEVPTRVLLYIHKLLPFTSRSWADCSLDELLDLLPIQWLDDKESETFGNPSRGLRRHSQIMLWETAKQSSQAESTKDRLCTESGCPEDGLGENRQRH